MRTLNVLPRPGVLDIEAYVPGKSSAPGVAKIYKLSSNALPSTKTGWLWEFTGKYDNSSASDFVELFQGTSWTDASSRAALTSATINYGAASATVTVGISSTDATKVTDGTALYVRITTTAA